MIRLGDPTSHGGQVVSATSNFVMFDKQVARIGDSVKCPKKGHGVCTIVEGDPTWTIDGRNVALEGHKTSCGAVLISTLPNVMRNYQGIGKASSGTGIASAASGAATVAQKNSAKQYDEMGQLEGEGNTDLIGLPYFIEVFDGRTFDGRVGEDGKMPRIFTEIEDEFTVYWGDEALAKSTAE